MTSVPRTPTVGTVLGARYEIVRSIARGGMGEVFEAEDRQLRRRVAIKVFRSGAPTDRVRFDAEVMVLARLSHPGLVQVFDAGEHDGDAFVVLELIDGPTLRAVLSADGPLGSERVSEVAVAVADALSYVHDQGVIHRDVTPANILCDADGRVRLADFGIARLVDTTRVTAIATTVGTAAYMAPEQVQGHDVTPAADVYALGLVLLELLTGQPAFAGSAQEAAVARLVRSPDVSAAPAAWRPILGSMSAREPANRPTAAGARDVARSLAAGSLPATEAIAVLPMAPILSLPLAERPTEPIQVDGGTTVMPAALQPLDHPATVPAGSRRSRGRVAAAVVGVMLLGVAVAVGAMGGNEDPPSAPSTTTMATTTSTMATTTTTAAPVVTATPADKPNGKGQGNDKKDDD